MNKVCHLREDVSRQGGDDVAEHLLILGQPFSIGGIRDLRIPILLPIQEFRRDNDGAIDVAHHLSAPNCGEHLHLPKGKVGLGELLGHRMANGGEEAGAGG